MSEKDITVTLPIERYRVLVEREVELLTSAKEANHRAADKLELIAQDMEGMGIGHRQAGGALEAIRNYVRALRSG